MGALFPYALCVVVAMRSESVVPAIAGATFALLLDGIAHYDVFVRPNGSTAVLAFLFVPLWSTLVFVPLTMLITRAIMRRREAKRAMKREAEPRLRAGSSRDCGSRRPASPPIELHAAALDCLPVDFDAEPGLVVHMDVAVLERSPLRENLVRQRIAVAPAVRFDAKADFGECGDEVRVNLRRAVRHDEHAVLLRELGHAQPFAETRRARRVELQIA